MEQPATHILERSSDAIVIICLTDKVVLGANEAFFAVTGHSHNELAGRHVHDLFLQVRSGDRSRTLDRLEHLGAFTDAPTALWTRTGELRYGHLSALLVDGYGDRTPSRCPPSVRSGIPRPPNGAWRRGRGSPALWRPAVHGSKWRRRPCGRWVESLRWEFGASWLRTPETQRLSCAVVWRSPWADLTALEESSRRTPIHGRRADRAALATSGGHVGDRRAGRAYLRPVPAAGSGRRTGSRMVRVPGCGQKTTPTGLTLKAVSRRTGIPAATPRTWNAAMGSSAPVRSANGYRLHGE
jgi:PAS domain S-box-containing protein